MSDNPPDNLLKRIFPVLKETAKASIALLTGTSVHQGPIIARPKITRYDDVSGDVDRLIGNLAHLESAMVLVRHQATETSEKADVIELDVYKERQRMNRLILEANEPNSSEWVKSLGQIQFRAPKFEPIRVEPIEFKPSALEQSLHRTPIPEKYRRDTNEVPGKNYCAWPRDTRPLRSELLKNSLGQWHSDHNIVALRRKRPEKPEALPAEPAAMEKIVSKDPPDLDQIFGIQHESVDQFVKIHPDIRELWVVTRQRDEKHLQGDRLPDVMAFATNEREAYEELIKLAGFDEEQIQLIGLPIDEGGRFIDLTYTLGEIHYLIPRLTEALQTDDKFDCSTYEVMGPANEAVRRLLSGSSTPLRT